MEWELEIKVNLKWFALARKKDKFYTGGKRWYFLHNFDGCWKHF